MGKTLAKDPTRPATNARCSRSPYPQQVVSKPVSGKHTARDTKDTQRERGRERENRHMSQEDIIGAFKNQKQYVCNSSGPLYHIFAPTTRRLLAVLLAELEQGGPEGSLELGVSQL